MSGAPLADPAAYSKTAPSLPGKLVCRRAQRGHFGPFFEWVDATAGLPADAKCPHCEGYAEITVEVESAKNRTYRDVDVDCPWCGGTGKAVDCDDVEDAAEVLGTGVWCDADGNVLDADIELEGGWITFAWLQQYEPERRAA